MTRSNEPPHADRHESEKLEQERDSLELTAEANDFLQRLSTLEPQAAEVDLVSIAYEAGRRSVADSASQSQLGRTEKYRIKSWFRHPAWAVATAVLLMAFVYAEALPDQPPRSDQMASPSANDDASQTSTVDANKQLAADGATSPLDPIKSPTNDADPNESATPRTNRSTPIAPPIWSNALAGIVQELMGTRPEEQFVQTSSNPWNAEIYSPQKRRWATRMANRPQDALSRPWDSELTALREIENELNRSSSPTAGERDSLDRKSVEQELEEWLKTEGF